MISALNLAAAGNAVELNASPMNQRYRHSSGLLASIAAGR